MCRETGVVLTSSKSNAAASTAARSPRCGMSTSSAGSGLPAVKADRTTSGLCVEAAEPGWSGTARRAYPQSIRKSSPDFSSTGCLKFEDLRTVIPESRERDQTTSSVYDMIGDLTGEGEPIQIKLFSQDPAITEQWAPKVADAIRKIDGVVDMLDGIENTVSGPAVSFQVDRSVA